MQISRNMRETSVFVLAWDDIEKVHSTLASRLKNVSISAKGADGLTRSFDDLEELKGFRNPRKSEIVELSIVARESLQNPTRA